MPVAANSSSSQDPFADLSQAARRAWGKHDRPTEDWLPLWQHMADSGAVAGRLWDEWVPANVKGLVAEVLPGGTEDGRRLAVWLAASHDVGKATPAFACQVEGLAQRMRDVGLDMPDRKQFGEDRKLAPHGLAGQLIIQEWLAERYGWTHRAGAQFAIVAGGHHGVPPGHQRIHDLDVHPELIRARGMAQARWKEVQYELLRACARFAGVEARLPAWQDVKLPQTVQVLLTATVILSDWIASSAALFPYVSARAGKPRRSAEERLVAAWQGLELPPAWLAAEPPYCAQELFSARFELASGIRPVQEETVRVARTMDPAGLLIVEAPMGEGKTEAALAAAEILAARTGAGGVLVALPTRATADAMFQRLLTWLEHLPADGPRSVFLAHARAALNHAWAGLICEGTRTIAAVDTDGAVPVPRPGAAKLSRPADLQAHQWLRGRKKGLLASFSVATVDQVLFGALKSRHLALRHLALAGKVVVIDEVHAYDAYMNVYVERALEWLAAYRVPVVLLSATLPAARRQALVRAYAGADAVLPHTDAYPLLTAVGQDGATSYACPAAASGRRTDIRVERLDDDLTSLVGRLESELRDGGCALVVRNTVDRVLEAAERLQERFGAANVTVAHSRFVAADRASKDRELLRLFGPDGDRPKGPHIVVASQVVEQSLDVDFDLLVTDLAPVDLLLQRMGRLHRHPRRRPAALRTARCLVTGADWQQEPPQAAEGSRSVYGGEYLLLRTLAVLQPHLNGSALRLPEDISPLVQAVYGQEPVGPAAWTDVLDAYGRAYRALLADKQERAEAFRLGPVRRAGRAVIGWVDAGVGDADDNREGRAQVRDSQESIEVLVVQRRHDGTLATLPWLDDKRGGLDLPEHTVPPRQAAEAAAASALTLPWHFSRPWVLDRTVEELERFCVEAWQVKECHWLAGELVLVLDEHCRTRLADFDLTYSRSGGLTVTPVGARDTRVVNSVPSFDLVSRPWLPVQRLDGTTAELSLRDVFATAGTVRRLVGDVPTQEFALLRLLLAVLHDAVEGPADFEAWEDLWEAADPFAAVPGYLERHRDRFDLLHPRHPFFQVADLHTEKAEVGPLTRIVADVPNGEPFFSMRHPGPDQLGFAEAARWLVHAHAFDVSGIKSGAVGDPRVKGGKGYPQGVGWAGNLGGVFAEGDTLRETLLLNLMAADTDLLLVEKTDLPVWRRPPLGAAPVPADPAEPRPSGPRDLYTWQSRRVRLHFTPEAVTGVVLGYGDPLQAHNRRQREPMTGWRRSPAQEKKLGRTPVYLPRQHDPARAAWRGLAALLGDRGHEPTEQRKGGPAALQSPGIVEWLALLVNERVLPARGLLRTRIVGARYGTQQSVIDEIVDDAVVMPVVALHRDRPEYARAAVDAVADADEAVTAYGHLAGNLARAVGSDPHPATDTARDLGFAALDGPYRHWLAELARRTDPEEARADWQDTVSGIVRDLGRRLLDGAGPAAAEGRYVDLRDGGARWVNDAQADLWFRRRLNTVLSRAAARRAAADSSANGGADNARGGEPDDPTDGTTDDTTELPQ
ncbi:type I-E CRISPR-associated protein Cse1/CasA [Actinacidiphila sp. ITFR-21]|uniref:type I-E CRISPR-associated protein Cse1/CasA n=1 Tax=Actinacidiphila sp. ITFR-21 TaxID=3075199 RepID=UPI0028896D0E|nr:type I-E CRISPR-associated protein Cse1/CasA [Streptomyces sp. ITFR-21]WNI16533.1 type I-E CRISPR-associated protein Cse1/CasA [Streptomyces sp. ITFR-21]